MANTKWALDPAHSEVHFKVRHLMVSNVSGHFKTFDATVETDGTDVTSAKVVFHADIDSISTNNEQRDAHLRNNDFFDAEAHPKLTFTSTKIDKIDEENYKMHGTFTMRGISKDITLHVEFGGIVTDPWGNTRAGFTVTGKVNRKDHGVGENFNAVSETGGLMLGADININANAEFVQVKEAVTA